MVKTPESVPNSEKKTASFLQDYLVFFFTWDSIFLFIFYYFY